MKKEFFGELENRNAVYLYTLKNGDAEIKISDLGATVVSFSVFGKDVVGGFDTLDGYVKDDSHQGATIGRVANRIAAARFTMDGKEYRVSANDNGNCLHGGCGFDYKVWQVAEYNDDSITLTYTSKDGEEGFPSKLHAKVRYILFGTALIIDYEATPEGKTPISMTNHSYFNLNGFGEDILSHTLTVYAKRYTKVGENLIPTGERPEVNGTPFDFTSPRKIGDRIAYTDGGYDHNFILTPSIYKSYLGQELGLAAVLEGDEIRMSVYTDQPGVQFYSGNFLGSGPDFKDGIKQIKHGALCLEAQTEPNSVNLGLGFYEKGEIYTQTTVYSMEKI